MKAVARMVGDNLVPESLSVGMIVILCPRNPGSRDPGRARGTTASLSDQLPAIHPFQCRGEDNNLLGSSVTRVVGPHDCAQLYWR
jgi:hypothetical protein